VKPEDRPAQSARNYQVLIDGCRDRFMAGEKAQLMAAINWCAAIGWPMPDWAASAYMDGYRRVAFEFKSNSWNTAFGKPHPGAKLPARRQLKALEWKVFEGVFLMRGMRPKPKAIFEKVAKKNRISVALCRKYFFDFQKQLNASARGDRESLDTKSSTKMRQISRR